MPMTDFRSIAKGVVSGSFVILGLFGSGNMLLQLILLILGAIVFTDGVMPFSSRRHTGTVIFFAAVGALLSAASLLSGFSLAYGILAVLIFLAAYFSSLIRKLAGLRRFENAKKGK